MTYTAMGKSSIHVSFYTRFALFAALIVAPASDPSF